MQTDPLGYKDGMNWYAYVGNDPVNGIDPSGTCGSRIEGRSSGTCTTIPGAGELDKMAAEQAANAERQAEKGFGNWLLTEANSDFAESEGAAGVVWSLAAEDPINTINAVLDGDGKAVFVGIGLTAAKPLKIIKHALGKGYPTKLNRAGKAQPFDPGTGRYLPSSANPGLANSPFGRFSAGFSQGVAEGYSGVTGATPVGHAGNLGYAIGAPIGTLMSIF